MPIRLAESSTKHMGNGDVYRMCAGDPVISVKRIRRTDEVIVTMEVRVIKRIRMPSRAVDQVRLEEFEKRAKAKGLSLVEAGY